MFKKIPLHTQIVIGLVLGIAWAIASSYARFSWFTIDYILPFGQIFINVLKLIAVPLVLFSIITGIANMKDVAAIGRIGVKTLSTYILTTVMAITVGLVLVNLIKPGVHIDDEQRIVNRMSYELWVKSTPNVEFLDSDRYYDDDQYAEYRLDAEVKNRFLESQEDVREKRKTVEQQREKAKLQWLVDFVPDNLFQALSAGNMLKVIFFAVFFGITIILLPKEKVKSIIDFCAGADHIFIKMVDIVMKGAPFFVFALMAGKLAEMAGDDPSRLVSIFAALGYYSLVVVIGLSIMVLVIYPAMVSTIISRKTKMSFFRALKFFLKGIRPAQLLAFSTSSSAATLPVTMECVKDNLNVDEEVSGFVLPIGATVNMDGTSLYQGVAVVFLAQFHLIDLTLAQQLTIIVTATIASIGSAAVPSAGLIMLIIVLESVGLNPAWIAIIFPVDRILDMCRTVVNVTGDAAVSTIVAQTEGKLHLKEQYNG